MSKHQRGNKEAKKPKKMPTPINPAMPNETTPAVAASTLPRPRK